MLPNEFLFEKKTLHVQAKIIQLLKVVSQTEREWFNILTSPWSYNFLKRKSKPNERL